MGDNFLALFCHLFCKLGVSHAIIQGDKIVFSFAATEHILVKAETIALPMSLNSFDAMMSGTEDLLVLSTLILA